MNNENEQVTYNANSRRKSDPAELPPDGGVVADHFLDAVVEAVDTERPRDGDALEEYQEEQAEPGDGVRVENLEHVHSTLEVFKKLTMLNDRHIQTQA